MPEVTPLANGEVSRDRECTPAKCEKPEFFSPPTRTRATDCARSAPLNTEEIRRELAAVELQWKWFENALALEGAHAYKLVVADASESIVNSMDRITQLYEQLAR